MQNIKNAYLIPVAAVFGAVMLVVVLSAGSARIALVEDAEDIVVSRERVIESALVNRLNIYEEAARAATGLFVLDDVTKSDWNNFVETSGVLERYPGVHGFGYAEVVSGSELAAFEASGREQINPRFNVYPEAQKDDYVVAKFIEPMDERKSRAVGYDISSEEERKNTFEKARDTGITQMTNAVQLVRENSAEEQQPGFLMFIPQYQAGAPIDTEQQRRDAIDGYVYVMFRSADFINSLSELAIEPDAQDLGFRITSQPNNTIYYETDNFETVRQNSSSSQVTEQRNINGATISFDMTYQAELLVPDSVRNRPTIILFFGTLVAALIAIVTFLLLRGKANQLALETERSVNDAKDSLLSIASHQLRTPATGVKQYIGMVLQGFTGDITPQQEAMLQKAYDSNERQLKTINDILYLARIESGRIVLSKSKIYVRDMLHSLLDDLKGDFEENEHTLVLHIPKKKKSVYADEHMIRMAIENLVTNAIKYTPNGGKIEITMRHTKYGVKLHVKDNGVGIAEEDREKLFKQFSRVKNELSKSVSGTGVGLYLTKYLVELHHGTVHVKSEEGEGSTFSIYLPSKEKK